MAGKLFGGYEDVGGVGWWVVIFLLLLFLVMILGEGEGGS